MDSFLQSFRALTDKAPSLKMVFLSWCAETNHWFHQNTKVQFDIIDDEGKDRSVDMNGYHLVIRNGKLYDSALPRIDSDPYTCYHG